MSPPKMTPNSWIAPINSGFRAYGCLIYVFGKGFNANGLMRASFTGNHGFYPNSVRVVPVIFPFFFLQSINSGRTIAGYIQVMFGVVGMRCGLCGTSAVYSIKHVQFTFMDSLFITLVNVSQTCAIWLFWISLGNLKSLMFWWFPPCLPLPVCVMMSAMSSP